jgi:hypothetical protein
MSVLDTVRVSTRSVLKSDTKEGVLFEEYGLLERSAVYVSQAVASLERLPNPLRHYSTTGMSIIQGSRSSARIQVSIAAI